MTTIVSADSLKRAARTFVIATLGLFVPGLLGWLHDLTSWASSNGTTPFPDAHGLAYLAVAAVGGGAIALLNLVVNAVEDATGKGILRDVDTTPPQSEVPAPEVAALDGVELGEGEH